MKVAVILALFACVAMVSARRGRGKGRMERLAAELRTNIAIVEQATQICETQLESATESSVTVAESNDGDSNGGSSGNQGRLTWADIAELRQDLVEAVRDLEDCKNRLQASMGGTTDASADSGAESGGDSK